MEEGKGTLLNVNIFWGTLSMIMRLKIPALIKPSQATPLSPFCQVAFHLPNPRLSLTFNRFGLVHNNKVYQWILHISAFRMLKSLTLPINTTSFCLCSRTKGHWPHQVKIIFFLFSEWSSPFSKVHIWNNMLVTIEKILNLREEGEKGREAGEGGCERGRGWDKRKRGKDHLFKILIIL